MLPCGGIPGSLKSHSGVKQKHLQVIFTENPGRDRFGDSLINTKICIIIEAQDLWQESKPTSRSVDS